MRRSLALRSLSAAAALAALAAPAAAQSSPKVTKSTAAAGEAAGAERGAFVVRLGDDTTAVERFVRTAGRLEGELLVRQPSVRVSRYVVDLDAAGRPTRIELRTRRPDGTPLPNAALGAIFTFRGDSVLTEVQTPDSVARFALAGVREAYPLPTSYAMWETAMRAARAAGRDSGAVAFYGPGAPRTQVIPVRFTGDDAATATYFGDPLALRVDRAGRLQHLDGSRSSNKSTVARVADVDVAALARDFAARPPMGVSSPRDTARATLGAAELLVDYGRPSVRGRTVWGGTLVPYGQVWRAGANAATQLRTSADLVVGGTAVPAGTYTLFVLPAADGRHQLIVNRQTGQWGTEYKPEQDLARIPLAARPLAQPVEQFTIAIEPGAGGAGTLALRWGALELTAPVAVK